MANLDPVTLEANTDVMTKHITDAVQSSLTTAIAAGRGSQSRSRWRVRTNASTNLTHGRRIWKPVSPSRTRRRRRSRRELLRSSRVIQRRPTLPRPPRLRSTHGPSGHGFVYTHRAGPFGETSPAAHPANGTPDFTSPMTAKFFFRASVSEFRPATHLRL